MTANEQPISDAELDAVLGAASARLDETLARTADVRAGLAAIAGPPSSTGATPEAGPADSGASRAENMAQRSVSAQIKDTLDAIKAFPLDIGGDPGAPADAVVRLGAELRRLDQLLAQRAIGRQDAQLVLQRADVSLNNMIRRLRFPGHRVRTAAPFYLVAGIQLGVVGAVGAVVLGTPAGHHIDVPFVTTIIYGSAPAAAVSGVLWGHRHRVRRKQRRIMTTQADAGVQLRKSLKELGVAVNHLFDDAEDRSGVPAGS